MIQYYATYQDGNKYPIIKVEFEKGDFLNRTEIKTGESFNTSNQALKRTGELNK